MVRLTKKHVILGGAKVRYLQGGTGKPLVFLHGWSTNPLSHTPSLEILGRSFTVYAPFLFDTKFNNVKDIATSMTEFIEKIGIQKTTLSGTSFGALIAGLVAYKQPKKVSRLLLINALGMPIETSALKMSQDSLKSYIKLLLELKLKVAWHRCMSGIYFHLAFLKRGMRDLVNEMKQKTHFCYIFHGLKVKTVLIWINKDVLFPLSKAHSLKQLIANSELIVRDGNHAWHYHSPELFAKTIIAACSSP